MQVGTARHEGRSVAPSIGGYDRSQCEQGCCGGSSTPVALVVAQWHSNLASLEMGMGAKTGVWWGELFI
jgi:hypothetical protein